MGLVFGLLGRASSEAIGPNSPRFDACSGQGWYPFRRLLCGFLGAPSRGVHEGCTFSPGGSVQPLEAARIPSGVPEAARSLHGPWPMAHGCTGSARSRVLFDGREGCRAIPKGCALRGPARSAP